MTPRQRVLRHSARFQIAPGYVGYDRVAYICHMLKLAKADQSSPIEAQIRSLLIQYLTLKDGPC
jgi:hypothetical protein